MSVNKTLWPEEVCEPFAAIDQACVARSWCDPSTYTDIVGVDFGRGEMHVYWCSTGRKKRVDVESAKACLLGLKPGTLVVGESAHLAVPRTGKSLAQPFTETELLKLYGDLKGRQITLKLFPHAHSGTRAMGWASHHCRELAGAKKSDANDAMAIALYVKHCNGVSLANPPSSFARCNRRDYGIAVRGRANIALNAERNVEYSGKIFPHVVRLGVEIHRKIHGRLKKIACVSVAALIATEIDGKPHRYVRNGSEPGAWLWLRHVARMTPAHHRGGIARSNFMRHSFRSFFKAYASKRGVSVGSKTKLVPFGQHDEKQRALRTQAMRAFRTAIRDAYRAGIAIARERGFHPFDPMADGQEASNGR